MVYSGTGSYEYQLELLYDSLESHAHHKWETIESISGSYDQDVVQNEMAEIKFERPVHIKVCSPLNRSHIIGPKFTVVPDFRRILVTPSDCLAKGHERVPVMLVLHRYAVHAVQCFHFTRAI